MTLAVQVGIDTLRAGRSIRVTARFGRSIRRALGDEAARLSCEDSATPGWVVLRLSHPAQR